MNPWTPHPDRAEAVRHFNREFRHRYWLRAIADHGADDIPEPEDWSELTGLGLPDPGCAVLARAIARATPRYLICELDAQGRLRPSTPAAWHEAFVQLLPGSPILVANPFGGRDNDLIAQARQLRPVADERRRKDLVGAAVGQIVDGQEPSVVEGRRSWPPTEYQDKRLTAEVAFVYDLDPKTLSSWRPRTRGHLSRKGKGRVPAAAKAE